MPDPERITQRLQALWEIARGPGGGADRPAFSAAEAQAMRLVAGWAREAGLAPGIDRHCNLWALPGGWTGPLVSSGSHVDTVPDGGRYDGALGTVLGLELAHDLSVADAAGPAGAARPALLICAAEEAPRFGAGTIGSRLLAGTLPESALEGLSDAGGVTAADARAGYLDELAGLPRIEAPVKRLRAHVEVHVAQRRELRQIGVVTRVAAPRRFEVEVTGVSGHVGEVSMEARRDALAAAAEIVLAVEAAARAQPTETVATVGTLTVVPGAISVIPGQAKLGIDVRAIDSGSLRRIDAAIRAAVASIAARRDIAGDLRLTRGGEPVALDSEFAAAALRAAAELGIPARETWSGAGHDAQHLARLTSTLLLFVPLEGGESHTPREGAAEADILSAGLIARDALRAFALDMGLRV